MNGKIPLTVTGNLCDAPELRFTPAGVAVASFVVASTPRTFDSKTNEWRDGTASFMRCSVWREQAENVAESLRKGDRVTVSGILAQHHWEDEETKAKRSAWELQADEVAASMKFARLRIAKATRQEAPGGAESRPAAPAAPADTEPPF